MPLIQMLRNWLLVFLACLASMVGCSPIGRVQTQEMELLPSEMLPSGHGWWQARYRINWPPNTDPIWYPDLYIAHQILKPVLLVHQNDIFLWRFHRRAARDDAGRQFSFIFFSSPNTAQNVFQSIRSNPMTDNLKFSGLVDDIIYDDPTKLTRPNIEDTSDKNWSAAIQKAWPYYIMGVSQMWLELIGQLADEKMQSNPPISMKEIESFYGQVDETMTNLWQKQGRHAFMHHLNALFGYKPLIYWEKRSLTF